jgi:hypothetical protein
MPIIRSSRVLCKWLLPVVFGAWFSSCRYVVELSFVCPGCGLQQSFQSDTHYAVRVLVTILQMHLITEWILMKFVNESVCTDFPLSTTPKKTQHFGNWNCFCTVVRGAGGTYWVPRWRICYSSPLNSSVHVSSTCHITKATDTVKEQCIIFYFLFTMWCTQCKL